MQKYKLSEIFEKQITGEWGKDLVEGNGVSIIRTTNFTNEGVINYDNVARRDVAQKKIESKALKQGDIIVEKSGGTNTTPTGRVVYCDNQIKDDIYLCNNFTQALRINKNIAFPKYVFYIMWYLHKIGVTDKLQNKTTGIRNLQLEKYLETEVSFPPLPEQERIAGELDTVCGVITKQKEQYRLLDELIKSKFNKMFGNPQENEKNFPMVTFADICKVRQGLQIPISKRFTFQGNNCYKYITVAYINGKKEEEFICNPKKSVVCTVDDLLMTRTGNTGMVITNVEGVFHNNFFLIDFNRKKYNKTFLYNYLNIDFIQQEIIKRAGSSTIPDLNHSDFYKIKIFEPPIALQNQFTNFVEQIDKLKIEVQKSLDETETLYKALMQKYFG